MPKRILYLIESLGAGGAEGALYSCLKFLDRRRFDGVVCPLYASNAHWREIIETLGYKIISPDLRGRWDWKHGIFELRRLLHEECVDLIHSQLYDANLYGRLLGRSLSLPVLTSLQSSDYEPEVWREDSGQNWLKLNLFRVLDKFTGNRWCTRWVAVSEFVRQSAIRRLKIPPSRIDIVYNSIDFQLFAECNEARRRQIRRLLGFDNYHLLMLFIARLHPQKGHRHLISALPQIASAQPNAYLLLVGAGAQKYRQELQALAGSLGVLERIRFLGIRRDIVDLLSACDLFVFPSLYEGLPLALLEALAVRRACVASRIGPIEEVIEDGVSGILVEPRNHKELAGAIIELLSDSERRRQLGLSGRTAIEAKFDIRKNIHILEQIYEKTLREWTAQGSSDQRSA